MKTLSLTTLLLSMALSGATHAATASFDDLPLAADSYYFPQVTTTFSSGGVSFNHSYTAFSPDCCHRDWIYSNKTDVTTAGSINQFSAYAGGGAQGSANYAIANFGVPTASFSTASTVAGAYFTNTTYAALSMLQGDSFAKKFGGASGNDADWLKLTIQGLDAANVVTGSVDYYLADYRFADNSLDYIVNNWTYVDLSSLGTVNRLGFALTSSDTGSFGINTPAYFALDSLSVTAVPEPSHALLFLSGLAVLGVVAKRRRNA